MLGRINLGAQIPFGHCFRWLQRNISRVKRDTRSSELRVCPRCRVSILALFHEEAYDGASMRDVMFSSSAPYRGGTDGNSSKTASSIIRK